MTKKKKKKKKKKKQVPPLGGAGKNYYQGNKFAGPNPLGAPWRAPRFSVTPPGAAAPSTGVILEYCKSLTQNLLHTVQVNFSVAVDEWLLTQPGLGHGLAGGFATANAKERRRADIKRLLFGFPGAAGAAGIGPTALFPDHRPLVASLRALLVPGQNANVPFNPASYAAEGNPSFLQMLVARVAIARDIQVFNDTPANARRKRKIHKIFPLPKSGLVHVPITKTVFLQMVLRGGANGPRSVSDAIVVRIAQHLNIVVPPNASSQFIRNSIATYFSTPVPGIAPGGNGATPALSELFKYKARSIPGQYRPFVFIYT